MTHFPHRTATVTGHRLVASAALFLGLLLSMSPFGALSVEASPFQPEPVLSVESGAITMLAQVCPKSVANGSPYVASQAQLEASCKNWTGRPITFTSFHSQGQWPRTTGSALFPAAFWDDVPLAPSAFAVAETIPAGFGQPRVFCDLNWAGRNSRLNQTEFPVVSSALGKNNAVAFALTPAQDDVFCTWYNIPSR